MKITILELKKLTRQIIKENKKYQRLKYNHILQEKLFKFKINENVDTYSREDVLNKIAEGDWEIQNAKNFKISMGKSSRSEMFTPYSEDELSEMKLFKVYGYNIGFALKYKDGGYKEIVAVHNNEPKIKNIGRELMMAAIKEGGCYLDHFDGFLSSFYESLGFEEYDRDTFDPQYDEDGSFRSKYGEADVIYRKHKRCK